MTAYRLPTYFLPQLYSITLDASPKRSGFKGVVRITGKLTTATQRIELNARAISVQKASVTVGGKTTKLTAKSKKADEVVLLEAAKPLPKAARVELELHYTGKLDPAMHGLYLAREGKQRSLVSQCEATDARAIFPCLDEPAFKAALQWTVSTDPGLTVITNGVAKGVRKGRSKWTHSFKATRPVSTYLAAVTIGDYVASKVDKVGGVPCRVLAARGKEDQMASARDVTAFVLPWYEAYFAQKYHYEKLDQVAVSGFDAGAMENIGAIFYRQSRLLMQPGQASWASEKSIAEVVAHEIAHQWFGNRVTMKWWDDLWLNEAFATWIAFKAIDEWKPAWRMWDDYQEEKESALFADALVNTHPIYTPVSSPAEATELFDVITYSKGGSVLRMLETYLGATAFRAGMRAYMDAFKDGNASGGDLWQKLGEASGQPVAELMGSWVQQSGFPLLTVEASERGGETVLHFSQRRFFLSREEMAKAHGEQWAIPIVVRYGTPNGVKTMRTLMRGHQHTLSLGEKARWVFPNADAIGFYRMHFSDEVLAAVLKHGLGELAPSERLSLLEDQWALVRSGTIDVSEFLDVLAAFAGEQDYAVVRAMAARVSMLDQRLVADADRGRFRRFVGALFQPIVDKVGLSARDGEDQATAVLRATALAALGEVAQDGAVLDAAEQLAATERHAPAAIEPNLAAVVVELAAIRGNAKLLDTYFETYSKRIAQKTTPELQARYLAALPGFATPALQQRVLAAVLDGTVPQESLRSVLVPMLSRRETQLRAWEFLKKNWTKIGPRVGAMGISRLVEATGALPQSKGKDVVAFFKKHPVDEAARALKKALEAMALTAELKAREGARLTAWLAERDASLDSSTRV